MGVQKHTMIIYIIISTEVTNTSTSLNKNPVDIAKNIINFLNTMSEEDVRTMQ